MLTRLRPAWDLIKRHYIWVAATVWITIFMEAASRGDWWETLRWSAVHLPLLLLNTALVGCLLALAALPTGHTRIAFWAVGVATVLFGAASGIKLKMLGRPLLPWDLAVAGEAADVINWGDILSFSLLVGLLVFILVTAYMLHKAEVLPKKVGWKQRAVPAGAAVLLLAAVLLAPPGAVARVADGEGTPWDQAHHVRTDGFLLSLADNLHFMFAGALTGPAVQGADVAAFLHHGLTATQPTTEKRAPNVILVLSESLWDPTRLPGAHFSQDPMPFFRSLQQKYPAGWMLSPEFAGGTANVELEVLTGLSMKFLPDGVLAYESHINRPVDSLASIFARQGYKSTVISPWASGFFNSQATYRNFGFGKFISVDFMQQEYNSPYLADHEIARNIIAESRKTPGPDFIFANTAENHYSYYPTKFRTNEISVTGVSEESRGILESYAQGCLYADRMLQTLVEQFEAGGEPTVIIFFGDHLPLLGKDYGIYKEAGYLAQDDPQFLNKLYRVPVVTWNNFLPQSTEQLNFGTNFLGPYILKQAGAPGTPVTEYLTELSARVPAVPPRRFWESWQIPAADMANYEALQTDILSGEQKAYDGFASQIVDPAFVLGYGPIVIDQVTRGPEGARVQGRNLPPGGVVLVNGKPAPAKWESYEAYSVQAPSDALTFQVKVFDLKQPDLVLAESNIVTLP
ncbi:MAG TPA: LTA synthase family protein [Symbiobacteriaceae bacterium]|nr:LTA synthase family protein [Symbiobacteriaceae bacterium]